MTDPTLGQNPPSVPSAPSGSGSSTPPSAPPASTPQAGMPEGAPVAPETPPTYTQPDASTLPAAYGNPVADPPGYPQAGYAQAGYPQPGYQPTYSAPVPTAAKTLSLIGMIAGIVGLLGFAIVFIPIVGSILGLFVPAAAVVLGFMGRSREGAPAKTFWITALVTGFIGLGIALIALVGWIALFAFGSGVDSYSTY